MNPFIQLFQADWIERVGWSLLHSIWQIALLAAGYALVSFSLRNRSAKVRYLLGCVTLVAMLALPLGSYFLLPTNTPPPTPATLITPVTPSFSITQSPSVTASQSPPTLETHNTSQPQLVATSQSAMTTPPPAPPPLPKISLSEQILSALQPWLPLITLLWLVGAALFSLRPLWGWRHVRRLQRCGLSPLPETLVELGQTLASRLSVWQAVDFLESSLVEVPTVVGHLKPLVLLPASMITGLTAEQINMILAHELAHIRRLDYLINLIQTVIEALLFYHPGMWWVSKKIRAERENCCDDIAISISQNRAAYVQALAQLEERRLHPTTPITSPALAATDGSLLARAKRLLEPPQAKSHYLNSATSLAGFATLCIVGLLVSLTFATPSTPPADLAVNDINDTMVDVSDFPQAVADHVTQIIEDADLPFITEAKLDAIHNDFRQFITKHDPGNLSVTYKRAIVDAIESNLLVSFVSPLTGSELNHSYFSMKNKLMTLQWNMYRALQRKPFTQDEAHRLQAQRQYLVDYILSLETYSNLTHQTELDRLNKILLDPLNTAFDRPLSDELFEQFKSAFQEKIKNRSGLGSSVNSFMSVYHFTITRHAKDFEQPFNERLGGLGVHNHWLNLSFPSNGVFRGGGGYLEDIEMGGYSIVYDTVKGVPVHVRTRFRSPEQFTPWLEQHGKGDLGFDADGGALIALRGAKLALLNINNWVEADAIDDTTLRAQINRQNKQAIALAPYHKELSDEEAKLSHLQDRINIGPYVGVLTKEGHLSVIFVDIVLSNPGALRFRWRSRPTPPQ